MKKILIYTLLCIFAFFGVVSQVSALNWVNNNGAKNCNSDPLDDTSGQKRIPSTNNLSATPSGTTPCEFHGYYSGSWSTWRAIGVISSPNHYSCPDDRYASQIEYRSGGTEYRIYCKYRDDTPPDPNTDITGYVPSLHNRLATSAETFRVTVGSAGGSPISLIQGFFEDNTNDNQYYSVNSDNDQNPGTLDALRITDWDIRNVDNDGSVNNGKRTYKVFLSYIADEAGNSVGTLNDNNVSNALIEYDYLVFADTLNIGVKSASSDLSSNINVADGTQKNVDISLRDQYGNKIIPVSDISRTIDFDFNIDNFIRRNQYDNTGTDTALYIDTTSNTVPVGGTQIESLDNRASTSGDYNFPFYVFAPTIIANPLVPGNGKINTISVDINGTLGSDTGISIDNSSDIIIHAKPLYTSQYIGDISDTGFIEGGIQNSTLNITKDTGSSTTITSPSVRMEFGTGSNNLVNPDYDMMINSSGIADGHQAAWTNTSQISSSFSSFGFTSFMTQQQSVGSLNRSYLASILKYTINIGAANRNIIYPSDVVGKSAYWGSVDSDVNSFQTGIRITGNTTSKNNGEILTGQFEDDVRIIGNMVKSTLRRDIEQKVYAAIRHITPKTTGSLNISSNDLDDIDWSTSKFDVGNTTSRGTSIFGERALYYGNLSGANVIINGAVDIEGEKTIVVEGGNVYITGDIINTDNDGTLGIIVLNGNIYIDPSVTDIEAILYTNQSIISYNGVELDGDTATTADIANQLYIYGLLFSENTIGGSRKTPVECPYYINTNCTTSQEAQKYDLNYLRRYFIYDSDGDGSVEYNGDDIPANAGFRSIGGAVGTGFEKYPVIVDYNPLIQLTPPPFFK